MSVEILADLLDEQTALERVIEPLDDQAWQLSTPSPGWTVAHQIAHLTYFDLAAAQAISDPAGFIAARDRLFERAMEDGDSIDDLTITPMLEHSPAELRSEWALGREELAASARSLDDSDRVEWFGPSMSARSFLTARLMEVWAHGQDIIDALDGAGVNHERREPTDRLRHIAHLGYVTRKWSYTVRGDTAPDADVAVDLLSPSGEIWTWGPADANSRITGPAADFCAVVTQRRNIADTSLVVVGDDAATWMEVAQAFAGGPTSGPAAGAGGPLS